MRDLVFFGLGVGATLVIQALILRLTSKPPATPPRRPRSYVILRD